MPLSDNQERTTLSSLYDNACKRPLATSHLFYDRCIKVCATLSTTVRTKRHRHSYSNILFCVQAISLHALMTIYYISDMLHTYFLNTDVKYTSSEH